MELNETQPAASCELPNCTSPAVGVFQVYDGAMPTMNRPAHLCQTCVDFARTCGMTPREVPDA